VLGELADFAGYAVVEADASAAGDGVVDGELAYRCRACQHLQTQEVIAGERPRREPSAPRDAVRSARFLRAAEAWRDDAAAG